MKNIREIIYNIDKKITFDTSIFPINNRRCTVLVTLNNMKILINTIYKESNKSLLSVNFQEKFYSNGQIPNNFFKKELKQSEKEILISRIIDRTIRSNLNEKFYGEISVTIQVLSFDKLIKSEILSILGVSYSFILLKIPFNIFSCTNVVFNKKKEIFSINIENHYHEHDIDILISSNKSSGISMIESLSNEVTHDAIINAIKICERHNSNLIKQLEGTISDINTTNTIIDNKKDFSFLTQEIKKNFEEEIIFTNKNCLNTSLDEKYLFFLNICEKNKKNIIYDLEIFNVIIKEIFRNNIRNKILKDYIREDNRKTDDIRKIKIISNFLPSCHGSAIFLRGKTHVIVTITLGSDIDNKGLFDSLGNKYHKERFYLHYYFPKYCVEETGFSINSKRREIGHAALARKSLISQVKPLIINNTFKTLRIVSDVISSDGSSSMATVCGATIALLNSGLEIKNYVAGIAMGLIKENEKIVVLSDISANEDYIGDMDLKISSTKNGITALQLDVKKQNIYISDIEKVFLQSYKGINYILDIMKQHKIKKKNIKEIKLHNERKNKANYSYKNYKNTLGDYIKK